MVKLVVADIDNTLVPKHKTPSARTLKCISEFNKRGILFGLASGRSTEGLRDLAKQWGIHCDILIGINGGEYQDELTGEYYVLDKLDKKYIKEIFEIMEPFKDEVNPSMSINGVRYVRRLDALTEAAFQYSKVGNAPEVVKDESIFWSQDAHKVGFRTPANIMKDVEAWVSKFPSEHYKGFKTEFTMFEFTPIECDKGKMLVEFCHKHNINVKDSVGIGDMTNDISLISDAGLGVCMFNGSDDAKAVADVITDLSIEDDGFADFVEKNILV